MSKKRLRKQQKERLATAGYVKTRNPIAYDHAHGAHIKGGVQGGDDRAQNRRERRQAREESRQMRDE
ncbi:MAG TPA: hypothetical protein VGM19_00435 [Armatimonadota bacterium]|jgi:hypothetical protein